MNFNFSKSLAFTELVRQGSIEAKKFSDLPPELQEIQQYLKVLHDKCLMFWHEKLAPLGEEKSHEQ